MSKPELGILELYNHPDALVDIVFVHGLRGGRKETWTKGTTLWPEKLLSEKVPQARILTFGYDADIYHFWSKPTSDNSIKNHADNLTAGLVGLRHGKEQTATRPIIFVAHSLGGLVCAQALSNAENDLQQPDTKSISDCTRRIAFLGTPHQGPEKTKWFESGKKFLSLLSGQPTAGVLKDSEEGSDTLRSLGIAFPIWLLHRAATPETEVQVVCFFEELSSSFGGLPIGKIVSEESARLKGYQLLSIHADHINMCKFSNSSDGNYQKLVEVLERWAKELKEETEKEETKKADTKPSPKSSQKAIFGDNNQGWQAGFNNPSGTNMFGNGGTWNVGSSHEK